MSKDERIDLIDDILQTSSEKEWVEFKEKHLEPPKLGETISALANSAALHQKTEAYLVFGVTDGGMIVGTKFDHRKIKGKGAEALEPWLNRNFKPRIEFKIEEVIHPKGRLVIFFIAPATNGPISFLGQAYIRIDSHNQKLIEYPEKEGVIWDRRKPFERKVAKENVSADTIFELLDVDQFFTLTQNTKPETKSGVIEKFEQEGFVIKHGAKIHITNLGAILLAKNLSAFPNLSSKAVRVITYSSDNNLNAIKDRTFPKGYAAGFAELNSYIDSQIPEPEVIRRVLRKRQTYPEKALREFITNALVHQDFSLHGTGPKIEIFRNKLVITNPGTALIPPLRFLDHTPRSRNEGTSDVLFRMHICEKRGSGVDRAIMAIEAGQLPPPKIEQKTQAIQVSLYARKELDKLTKEERRRACYWHSCIQYVHDNQLTNASLSLRLGIGKNNVAITSRIIKDAVGTKLIKPFDPENKSHKNAKYIPIWA